MEKVIMVALHNKKPWMVTVTKDGKSFKTYCVEYCKRDDELYFSESAAGGIKDGFVFIEGGADYWLADGYQPKFNPGSNGNRLNKINSKWNQHPEKYGIYSEIVYCDICKDYFPTCEVIDYVCDHVYWNAEDGWWDGEGYNN